MTPEQEKEIETLRMAVAMRGFNPVTNIVNDIITIRLFGLRNPELNYEKRGRTIDELALWRELFNEVPVVPSEPWDGRYDDDTSHALTTPAHALYHFLRKHPNNDEYISSDEIIKEMNITRKEFDAAAFELESRYRVALDTLDHPNSATGKIDKRIIREVKFID